MTPRTLFTIILKIFGLWLILGLLQVIPQTLSSIPMFFGAGVIELAPVIFGLVLIIAFYFFVVRLFLFRTDYLIDKLSLDKHFDQPIEVNIQQKVVIQIAIIVLGGLIFIEALPSLIQQIVSYLQQKRLQGVLFQNPGFQYIILHGCKLLLGYLLMNNSKWLTDWIEKRQQK